MNRAAQIIKNSKINMEGEKKIQLRRNVGAPTEASEKFETSAEVSEGDEELLSEKALEDDLELDEDLDRLPI